MKLAAVHLRPVFRDPALHPFLLEKDVSESYRLYFVVVGHVVVPVAAGRSAHHSGWTHPASCLDHQSLVFSRTLNRRHTSPFRNGLSFSCSARGEGLMGSLLFMRGSDKDDRLPAVALASLGAT
jgi:hypothetical protein